ncbi:hypothetical protein AX14_002800 [Amanita brunnescens Koide BX004]|nr:hypothetical protein AX14_002800 [Amanita brunnescens Koide BX004]
MSLQTFTNRNGTAPLSSFVAEIWPESAKEPTAAAADSTTSIKEVLVFPCLRITLRANILFRFPSLSHTILSLESEVVADMHEWNDGGPNVAELGRYPHSQL